MAFSISSNLSALNAYNALAKVNAQTQTAQLRLATGKRINSVADDTSAYSIGTSLQSKTMVYKSQLNNVAIAQNYLSTAETALVQIDSLITQISAKYTDSQNPLADKDAIANDIKSIASEIDSILKSTKFNDKNLLAQSDGSALASNDVFNVGSDVTMDFAGSTYLDTDTLTGKLHGSTGVTSYTSSTFDENATFGGGGLTLLIERENSYPALMIDNAYTFDASSKLGEVADSIKDWIDNNSDIKINVTVNHNGANSSIELTSTDGNAITKFTNNSTFDLANLGISTGDFSSSSGGLLSDTTDDVLTAASDLSAVTNNVKKALGRIGNLTQTLNYKSDFLNASIVNSTSSISRLFDTDMAAEQLNAAKGSISTNAATSMLSQLNMAPQSFLQLLS